jgi:hypothetical protein
VKADPSLFKPFSRLVRIHVLGRTVEIPENNTLLRGFQFLCPTTVPYGKFCWNNECGNSKFYYRLPGDPVERKARACWFIPVEGMEITVLSAELKYVLREVLKQPVEQVDGAARD